MHPEGICARPGEVAVENTGTAAAGKFDYALAIYSPQRSKTAPRATERTLESAADCRKPPRRRHVEPRWRRTALWMPLQFAWRSLRERVIVFRIAQTCQRQPQKPR